MNKYINFLKTKMGSHGIKDFSINQSVKYGHALYEAVKDGVIIATVVKPIKE